MKRRPDGRSAFSVFSFPRRFSLISIRNAESSVSHESCEFQKIAPKPTFSQGKRPNPADAIGLTAKLMGAIAGVFPRHFDRSPQGRREKSSPADGIGTFLKPALPPRLAYHTPMRSYHLFLMTRVATARLDCRGKPGNDGNPTTPSFRTNVRNPVQWMASG
jgi:hypothetical protein